MPFCINCGSQVEGRFCEKCGTAASASGAPAQAAATAQAPAAPVKKSNTLAIVLIAVAAFVVLVVGGVVATGAFVAHKVKQAAGIENIKVDPRSGSVDIKTSQGTARFSSGSAVKLPSWLPAYDGAKDAGGLFESTAAGESGMYGFKTSDPPSKVLDFYEAALKKAGFTVEERVTLENIMTMGAENGKVGVQVGTATDSSQTNVNINFAPKDKESD